MKILLFPRYSDIGASSRIRSYQYLSWLESKNIQVIISPLIKNEMLLRKYQYGGYCLKDLLNAYFVRIKFLILAHHYDLIWIEKEALPWFPAWFERLFYWKTPYVLDFDDAIFHNYDLHSSALVRFFYKHRIDSLMKHARLIIAGNSYLADRATSAGSQWVEVIPSVVDLSHYHVKKLYSIITKPRIVWIGSPSTVQYLMILAESLIALSKVQQFTLRVIGGGAINIKGLDVESCAWSVQTEAALIKDCDIGIMPLDNTSWEKGKCAYKLIQYMACGLPTVASPVGANLDVVIEGKTGYFAETSSEWVEKIELLILNVELRKRLGQSGRKRVEEKYCLQQSAPRLVGLFNNVVG